MPQHEPLEKLVAHRAALSRRLAKHAIRRGRVSVDGNTCTEPRQRVAPTIALTLDGAPLAAAPPVALWHKPAGVHCTVRDPHGRPSLESAAKDLLDLKLHPVGRLDADTSGLLLFAAEGKLTQRLLHPKHAVPRTYVAAVEGSPGPTLTECLQEGVRTALGVFAAESVEIHGTTVTLTVREGKHRMVRRMLANAGHPVVDLRRIAFGPFQLGELPTGQWRPPEDDEATWLDALT
ncbi:MAG: pseudouridine synthase [Myxococcales bacterium]|nr:pseudouridine synthase [Myxococcales bacterium]